MKNEVPEPVTPAKSFQEQLESLAKIATDGNKKTLALYALQDELDAVNIQIDEMLQPLLRVKRIKYNTVYVTKFGAFMILKNGPVQSPMVMCLPIEAN